MERQETILPPNTNVNIIQKPYTNKIQFDYDLERMGTILNQFQMSNLSQIFLAHLKSI